MLCYKKECRIGPRIVKVRGIPLASDLQEANRIKKSCWDAECRSAQMNPFGGIFRHLIEPTLPISDFAIASILSSSTQFLHPSSLRRHSKSSGTPSYIPRTKSLLP